MGVDLNLNELARQISKLLEDNSAIGMMGAAQLAVKILSTFGIQDYLRMNMQGGSVEYERFQTLRDEIELKLIGNEKFDADYLRVLQAERQAFREARQQI